MPVTINCASVDPEVYKPYRGFVEDHATLFQTSGARQAVIDRNNRRMYGDDDDDDDDDDDADSKKASSEPAYKEECLRVVLNDVESNDVMGANPQITNVENGLVNTICTAYNHHYHLVLRPDDVWIALLAQFSLYVTGNAEELRSKFVAHEGKKELEIQGLGNIHSADFGAMAKDMGVLLEGNIKDPSLRSWIIPDFSTTTPNDTIVASILMMATLQKYFDYKFGLMCGIPSVTLLGSVEDWRSLRSRVDRFAEFLVGDQASTWTGQLQKICDSFVDCFDSAKEEQSKEFFSRVCHYAGGGSGPTYLSGWITLFTVFSKEGKWQGGNLESLGGYARGTVEGSLDGKSEMLAWPLIDTSDIAPGVAEVPVTVDDNGTEHKTVLLGGLPAMRVGTNEAGKSVLSPAVGWAMFDILS